MLTEHQTIFKQKWSIMPSQHNGIEHRSIDLCLQSRMPYHWAHCARVLINDALILCSICKAWFSDFEQCGDSCRHQSAFSQHRPVHSYEKHGNREDWRTNWIYAGSLVCRNKNIFLPKLVFFLLLLIFHNCNSVPQAVIPFQSLFTINA